MGAVIIKCIFVGFVNVLKLWSLIFVILVL